MKKTLYTYILREQYPPVLMCLAGACFVLVTGQLLQLMRILFASSCGVESHRRVNPFCNAEAHFVCRPDGGPAGGYACFPAPQR